MFEDEQKIFDAAQAKAKSLKALSFQHIEPAQFSEFVDSYDALAYHYGDLLTQLKETTSMTEEAITDLLENSFDMKDKMHIDALTGVYNRRYLEEGLAYLIKTMSRFEGLLTILMLDIDYFKKYNDHYGHGGGDMVLRTVAQSFTSCITREEDFVARYGGEEFVIVLPYTDRDGACFMAQKILADVESRKVPHAVSDVSQYLTVSIGVTTVRVRHTHQAKDYIECADKGLYLSKNSGRNRYTFVEFSENRL